MLRKAFAAMVVLTLMFALGGGAAGSAKAAEAEQGDPKAERCTAEHGQLFIDEGRYKDAIREFTCVIEAQPTEVEGYRGRIEAELLLGRYSDAVRDYARVTALVLPVHPDAEDTILDGYAEKALVIPHSKHEYLSDDEYTELEFAFRTTPGKPPTGGRAGGRVSVLGECGAEE